MMIQGTITRPLFNELKMSTDELKRISLADSAGEKGDKKYEYIKH